MPRPSPVRDALRGIVERETGHRAWSLDELHRLISDRTGGSDYSSVFRAAALLEAEGVLVRLDLGDGLSRFEAAGAHHEHVRCQGCGIVAEIPGCAVAGVTAAVESSTGFRLSGHQVVFSGICPSCVAALD